MRLLGLPSWPTTTDVLVLAQTSTPTLDPADWIQVGGTAAALGIAFMWVRRESKRADDERGGRITLEADIRERFVPLLTQAAEALRDVARSGERRQDATLERVERALDEWRAERRRDGG